MIVEVKENQTIYDLVLYHYGSMSALEKFVQENNLEHGQVLFKGQNVTIDDAFVPNERQRVTRNYLKAQGIEPATGYTLADIEQIVTALTVSLVNIQPEIVSADGFIIIEVQGGTKPYSYEWKDAFDVVISNSQNLTGVSAGIYSIKVTDADSTEVSINITVGAGGALNYLVDEFGNIVVDEFGQPIEI